MKFVTGLILCGVVFCFSSVATAADGGFASRLAALEEAANQRLPSWLKFSGAIEVEAGYSSGYDNAKESDVDLTNVELRTDVPLTDYFSGYALMKWEEDGSEGVFIDEAGIVLGSVDEYGISVTAGKLYVPFGVFETGMISDPLTLELGETREGAVVVDFGAGGFYGATYTFNSEVSDDADDDMIDAFGVVAGYTYETEEISIDLSAGWISNLTSSGGFSDYLDDAGIDLLDDYTAGATVSAIVSMADFTLIGEYLTALDNDYLEAEDDEPATWNLELDYGFKISEHDATIAVSYQGSDEAALLGLPETRIGATFGFVITDGLGIALEYIHDEDYDTSDGGTDESADTVTCQLALEF